MAETEGAVQTVAEAYLTLLKARGVDWLFANAGTDFAPIIEALARGATAGLAMPEPLAAPHETVAVGMAHGYYLATGRPQAVMVHVNVGMANALMGLLNAARDGVPILFTSGRTPVTEAGRLGSRDLPIHWGQEMYDQGGMLREYVKWDYELRFGEQLERIVDRALAIAMSPPRGPVYLSLPREALAAPMAGFEHSATPAPARTGGPCARPRGDRRGGGDPCRRRAAADHLRPRRWQRAELCRPRPLRRALRHSGGRVLAVPPLALDRAPAARGLRRRPVVTRGRRRAGAGRDGALAAATPQPAGRLPGDPGRP